MTIEGIADNIIYRNDDTGYTVLELETYEGTVCTVGIMPMVSVGEYIEAEGDYTLHHNYGRQFVVSSYETALPATETAMLKYLSSGVIRGVGPKTAKQIVERFGPATFNIIEKYPEELEAIRGISRDRAEQIHNSYLETSGVKNILLSFQQFGFTAAAAFRVYKEWGPNAYETIKKNPYRLCEIKGFSFEKADAVALSMDGEKDRPERVKAALCHILEHNLYSNGHTFLPREKLVAAAAGLLALPEETVAENLEILIQTGKLVFVEKISNTNGVYLAKSYESEKNIADRVVLSSAFSHEYHGNFEKDIKSIEKELGIVFAEKQREAIRESVCHGVFILTGGPGTGKTTTLRGIVRMLEKKDLTYTLAAPTGRAAKRISELCGKDAKTIHRLLEFTQDGDGGKFMRNKSNPLDFDVVIVDEASMVDFLLFNSLLEALPVSSSVILVGDVNQLPPVGPGSVLKDMIGSGSIRTVVLNEIFRQAEQSLIVTNAHKIINGVFPEIKRTDNDFFFLPARSAEEVVEKVCDLYSKRLPAAYGFDPITDIQVLSPTRKGITGTGNLNDALKDRVNPSAEQEKCLRAKGRVFYRGDKVMQTKNNYDAVFERDNGEVDTGVFNGDIGVVTQVLPAQESIVIRFDDREICYTSEMLEDIEHAYAVTVHKSQGSEFDAVILPLWTGPEMLYTRNLLYTAVTRAKKIMIIVGSAERLDMMVKNNYTNKRYSGLKFKIEELSQ